MMKRGRRVKINLVSGGVASTFILGGMFFLGGVLGCITAIQIDGETGAVLEEYLRAYLSLAREHTVDVSLWEVIWEQTKFPLFAFALGLAAVGVIGLPILFSLRGFLFSFSVACFCRIFGTAGLVPAVFLFGFPAFLWAPALFILGVQALQSSYAMARRFLGDHCQPAFFERAYWTRCAVCVICILFCIVLEYTVLPLLIGASAKFVL